MKYTTYTKYHTTVYFTYFQEYIFWPFPVNSVLLKENVDTIWMERMRGKLEKTATDKLKNNRFYPRIIPTYL